MQQRDVDARPTAGAGSSWIDVTVPIRDKMIHWPGDPPVEVSLAKSLQRGDCCNVTRLAIGAHTGTHVDAPVHFLPGAAGVDAISPDKLMGPARVLNIMDPQSITAGELARHDIVPGERILFRTRNSDRNWMNGEFFADYVYVEPEAARYLVARGVRTVGVDYLSVASEHDAVVTHQELLGAGVCVIEGLDLSGTPEGDYELICLPLRIAGGDGAPARALLRRNVTAPGGPEVPAESDER